MSNDVRLSNVLAQYADATTRLKKQVDAYYHTLQKETGLSGFHKRYERAVDEGIERAPQTQLVQINANDLLKGLFRDMGTLVDATATKDYANAQSTADVVVGGKVLLRNAPPTLLVSLEKQLTDLRSIVSKLPVLPPDENWRYDENRGLHVSDETTTYSQEVVKRPIVLYDATDKHPAQTQIIEEPKIVGKWKTTKFSGAVPSHVKEELQNRTQEVLEAVKTALHEANAYVAQKQPSSLSLLGYIAGDSLR